MRVPWWDLEYSALTPEERDQLRWTCPHGDNDPCTPVAGLAHIENEHQGCWSCSIESIILREMQNGRVWFWMSHEATAHPDEQR